jgi:hypothetical protein
MKMRLVADAVDALAISTGKPALVGEIGLRSAIGAAAKPWESPEERDSAPDPALQAEVLRDWITVLDRPGRSRRADLALAYGSELRRPHRYRLHRSE